MCLITSEYGSITCFRSQFKPLEKVLKMLMMMMTLEGLKVSSCMRAHVSPDHCCKTNPSPCRLTSVHSRGLVKEGQCLG